MLVDSNKILMEMRKVFEIRWLIIIKCMWDVLGVFNNINDYVEKDLVILKSEGGGVFLLLKINVYKIEYFLKW